jgi:nicotinamide-nucleotide amidase
VDPDLEAWLRELWSRRDMVFPESNLKQAWLLPSATALANPNGTAPGWFVERSDGGVIVALPGPPREMRPMWHDHALPRLREHGLGADVAARTYRLMGIGESQVAELLGEHLLRTPNPEVATYARVEAVDVRVSAVGGSDGDGTTRSAEAWLAPAAAVVEERLAAHIWATGTTTWAEAIGARLAELGWRLGVVEVGTGGQVGALFGDVDWLARVESQGRVAGTAGDAADVLELAERARVDAGAQVGVAVRTRERGGDTAVTVGVVTPLGSHRERRMAFLGGHNGRTRAALVAASVLFVVLRDADPDGAAS